ALDASLDDSLADDIDEGVAAELGARPGFDQPGFDSTAGDAMVPLDDEDLPFDPAAAREFDAVMRGSRRADAGSGETSSAPTFDPGAAAAFDRERDQYVGPPSGAPAPEQMGAHVLPAESFDAQPYDGSQSAPGYTTEDEAPQYAAYADDGGYGQAQYADAQYVNPYAYDQGGTVDQPVEPYPAAQHASAAPRTLEDDLDDADYYMQHGMWEEAEEVLRALVERHPHHPLVAARMRDLEAQIAAEHGEVAEELVQPASGGTETVDVEDLEEIDPEVIEEGVDDDEMAAAFDEAQRVIAGRHDDAGHHGPPSSRPAVVLEKPLEDSDGDTHFDLGLAYKEMGLYDEAMKAFEKVAQSSPTREVQSRMMIGLCQREQGNLSEAVHHFKAGLHAASINDREKQTLLYEIGATYESLGDPRESVYYFEMVVKRDPSFLDARDRLARLRSGSGGNGRRRGALDETGDAIDSLLADDV
ncbi:MAG: tetratricopeptide repeat protein, partial [Deltaproteobacteria bacterium]|nr:tetratricopeptide repeat protein [Kofleriaceae bacterium]